MLWEERRPRGREAEIEAILGFISRHPHSYASLAVCRRALDSGIDRVDSAVIHDLDSYLQHAPDDEIQAFYSIIG